MALIVVLELAETLKNRGPILYAKSISLHIKQSGVHIFYKCTICDFKHLIFASVQNHLLFCIWYGETYISLLELRSSWRLLSVGM
jgi:hypothetical protein